MAQQEAPPARVRPAAAADERELLSGFLDWYRETLLWKVRGLSDDQLTRRLVRSQTTLLGLVKHLGYVERNWFQIGFNGEDLPNLSSETDPDPDFRIEPDETPARIVAFYREQIARSQAIVAGSRLDDVARRPGSKPYTLRWILLHMIEETARHAGHADILRELTDGTTGQ